MENTGSGLVRGLIALVASRLIVTTIRRIEFPICVPPSLTLQSHSLDLGPLAKRSRIDGFNWIDDIKARTVLALIA
jgi:hypothetical protein